MCVKYAKNYSDKILLHVHLSSVPVSSLEVPVDFVSCLHSEPLWNTSVLVELLAQFQFVCESLVSCHFFLFFCFFLVLVTSKIQFFCSSFTVRNRVIFCVICFRVLYNIFICVVLGLGKTFFYFSFV